MSYLCPVAVAQDAAEDEYQPETAGESHFLLLKQKKYCDVIFTFPNMPDRIEAHKFCLKARSPVLAKIFRMRKSENVQSKEIVISESTPEIFQKFLEFIYADKLEVDIAGALELIQLSHKYKVHQLTKKCEELLKTDIPIVDSVKIFETARRYGRQDLMDRAGPIMVQSFLQLAGADALANAEEETLVYLLECDDLAVKEVELFQFILDWGRNKVEDAAEEGLLKNKLKNLIWKIMYTNMAPDEFTKVVLPTRLMSAEETVSVYAYFCGDEVTRGALKTEFNTTRRRVGVIKRVTETVDFYEAVRTAFGWFPAFSKHSISFIADRTQIDGKVQPDYSLRKTVIRAIPIWWPSVDSKYREHCVLNFEVSVVEYSSPAKEGNFTIRFQRKLLNCKEGHLDVVSVEPPVELVPGRTYSLIVEDHSTSDANESFHKDANANACNALAALNINREVKFNFEDVSLNLRDIHRKTDFYAQNSPDWSGDFSMIRASRASVVIGLLSGNLGNLVHKFLVNFTFKCHSCTELLNKINHWQDSH